MDERIGKLPLNLNLMAIPYDCACGRTGAARQPARPLHNDAAHPSDRASPGWRCRLALLRSFAVFFGEVGACDLGEAQGHADGDDLPRHQVGQWRRCTGIVGDGNSCERAVNDRDRVCVRVACACC